MNQNYGIARVDTTMFFPLSPQIMIQLFANEWMLNTDKRFSSKMYVLGERDQEYVTSCNLRQIEHCYRETFVPVSLMGQIMTDENNS